MLIGRGVQTSAFTWIDNKEITNIKCIFQHKLEKCKSDPLIKSWSLISYFAHVTVDNYYIVINNWHVKRRMILCMTFPFSYPNKTLDY